MSDLEARFRKIKKLVKEEEEVQDQLRGQIEDLSKRLSVSIQTAMEIESELKSYRESSLPYLLSLTKRILQQA